MYFGKASALGVRFFSEVTTAFSREVATQLAIIDAQAGLVTEQASLIVSGASGHSKQVLAVAETIQQQVHRIDALARCVNYFAHNVQQGVVLVNVRELLDQVVCLAAPWTTTQGVTLALGPMEDLEVQTLPFAVENLLWICLKNMCIRTQGPCQLTLDAHRVEAEIGLSISNDSAMELAASIEEAIAAEGQSLILLLRAQIRVDRQNDRLLLHIARKFIE